MFNLSKVRKSKNITISELSAMTDISQRTLEDIELRCDTKYSIASVIAKALKVSLDKFDMNEMCYKYHIADASNRAKFDLRTYSNQINQSVLSIFPNVSVSIFRDYFQIETSTLLEFAKLRNMGKLIAASSPDLNELVKAYQYTRSDGTHAVSHQLFKRFN